MIIIDNIDQRSESWHKLRAGIPTASEFSRIVKENGDPSKSRQDYLYELAGERIIGMSENGYQSWDMLKGIEREDEARAYYEFLTGETVKQVGFVFRDKHRNVGCSPDGLIMHLPTNLPKRGLEIKAPKLKNHVAQLLTKTLPPDKYHQIQGCMWVCSLYSWSFISYYPGMELFILDIQRDYKFTSALEYEMEIFIEELDAVEKELRE